MISGAEKLKQLAACVNEIRQKDGSIVKEYILNDPKIIEHIKSQIKSNNTVHEEIIQKNITITAYQVDGLTISNDNQQTKELILNDQTDKETLIKLDSQLSSNNSKKPNIKKINFVAKNEYCLSAPDFMLGVLNQYITKDRAQNNESCFKERMFRKLKDMYTVILNTDTGNKFTRKNPFYRESF
jgi:hypothetical protein